MVFHHTAITYGGAGSWFYREVPTDFASSGILLVVLCTVDQAWFMGLFFLLAGRFTPDAIRAKGRWPFLRERLLRLGVPWLVFGLAIGPATVALAATAANRDFVDVLLRQWQRGRFEPGPLWFAQALLIFSLVAALWPRWHAPRAAPFPSHRALVVAAIACAVTAFAVRLRWPVGTEVAHLQLGYFASYVLLFATGCMAASRRWLERLPEALVRRWRRISLWTLPALLPLALLKDRVDVLAADPAGGWSLPALLYAAWEPFVAWGLLLGLLAFVARRDHWANGWPRLARRAYGIFVLHPPVVVAVALAWRSVAAPPLVKFAVTGTVACLLCDGIVGVLLRSSLVRRIL